MVHHVTLNTRQPGGPPHTKVHHEGPIAGSLRCELEVLEVQPIPAADLPQGLREHWPSADPAWESLLVLRTGRTHQVPT